MPNRKFEQLIAQSGAEFVVENLAGLLTATLPSRDGCGEE